MMHPFEILAEPIRRRVVEVLAIGEHPAGELADAVAREFSVSVSAVSHHMRTLRDNDVVLVTVDGSTRLYRLNPEALDRLDEVVAGLFDLWDRRYGWRYERDVLPSDAARSRRTHRAHDEGYRHRRQAGEDPWRWRETGSPLSGL